MSFIEKFNNMADVTNTENGGRCYSTTGSKLLDFFSVVGGMRDRSESDIIQLFLAAREEDKELADKIVLYARSIRGIGGLGERRIGKILMRELAKVDSPKVRRNFQTLVDNGRFDDLYVFENTPVEDDMWQFMKDIFFNDLSAMKRGEPITLAAKWMKSINTSSAESKRLAKKFCKITHIDEKTYRKSLSALRKYSNVVEVKMSSNNWNNIKFDNVPSLAMKRYSNAFGTHCPEEFNTYKQGLITGEKKINAATLYPYDITYQFMYNGDADTEILEAQWNALPNYFKEGRNIVCCADVSGSMYGRPMATSIGLALYCAQHNTGAYHGSYLTFTDIPRFFTLDETTSLENNINKVMENVGYNTNLDGCLEAIYEIANEERDVPEALLIISDEEIDYFISSNNYEGIVDKWVDKYNKIGLKCPKIIFWNVDARNNHYLSKASNPYVSFISGSSAGTFANLSTLIDENAIEAMKKILSNYNFI